MNCKISKSSKNLLTNVARKSLEYFLKNGQRIKFNFNSVEILKHRAVFVTLRENDSGELRGCIGHTKAYAPLVEAVADTAISSACEDTRFSPLTFNELRKINIEINVLSKLINIVPEEIEIGKHGILLINGTCRGLFLPEVAVSNGWDRTKFLDELSLKSGLTKGIWKDQETELYAFESESWSEN